MNLPNPPPRLFFNEKEENFVHHINNELIEQTIGQQLVYYPLDTRTTKYHPVYGEAINKNFLPPVHIYALVLWDGSETNTTGYGVDKWYDIEIGFFKRRVETERNLYVRVGDFVFYGGKYFEIVQTNNPRELYANPDNKVEISALAIKSRDGTFNGR